MEVPARQPRPQFFARSFRCESNCDNKSITGGIEPDEFEIQARRVGFSHVETTYEWYAGQGKILHGVSAQAAAMVDDYLRLALPLSRGLYKYLRFRAIK